LKGLPRHTSEPLFRKIRIVMSASSVRLLEVAAEMLGGEAKLARYLNIGETLLRAFMEDRRPLPDLLLLRAVDVVLENMQRPALKAPEVPAVSQPKKSQAL
jgi:hypothetical protein